jgi:hypothetical protein
LRVESGQIRGQTEKKWNFGGQLGMKLNKLKTKDSFVKGVELWSWYLNLTRVQLYAIKSWEIIMDAIKSI